jgi:hypothetical protein
MESTGFIWLRIGTRGGIKSTWKYGAEEAFAS